MAHIRFWQPSDLPELLRMAALTAWEITPADDRAQTSFAAVMARAQNNLLSQLNSPVGTAIVAEQEGRPVGYLLLGLQVNDRTGEQFGYMADIYLEPAFRGAGLTEAMRLAAEAHYTRLGLQRITNWVHGHNRLGLRASERFGFRPWAVMMSRRLDS